MGTVGGGKDQEDDDWDKPKRHEAPPTDAAGAEPKSDDDEIHEFREKHGVEDWPDEPEKFADGEKNTESNHIAPGVLPRFHIPGGQKIFLAVIIVVCLVLLFLALGIGRKVATGISASAPGSPNQILQRKVDGAFAIGNPDYQGSSGDGATAPAPVPVPPPIILPPNPPPPAPLNPPPAR